MSDTFETRFIITMPDPRQAAEGKGINVRVEGLLSGEVQTVATEEVPFNSHGGDALSTTLARIGLAVKAQRQKDGRPFVDEGDADAYWAAIAASGLLEEAARA